MALEAGNIDEALKYVECALQAAERSYKVRQADAHIMHGRILEAINLHDPAAEEEFRLATKVLADTDRLASRSSAHSRLARHLFKKGKAEEGEKELEIAHTLVDQVASRPTSQSLEHIAQ
jgi:tetratricopeptide (TPR) repeat protein